MECTLNIATSLDMVAPLDQLSEYFGTASLLAQASNARAEHWTRQVFVVYVLASDLAAIRKLQPQHTGRGQIAAAFVLFLDVPPPSTSDCRRLSFIATIVGLRVGFDGEPFPGESLQRRGLGTRLYMKMHERVLETCQMLYQQRSDHDVGSVEFSLGPGQCRRSPEMRAFLCRFGFGSDDVIVRASLNEPYRDPLFVIREKAYAVMPAGPTMDSTWTRTFTLNLVIARAPMQLLRGVWTCAAEGVVSFIVPASACRIVEDHLSDHQQWTTNSLNPSLKVHPRNTMHNMRDYRNVNSQHGNASEQRQWRAISRSVAQAKDAMDTVPGLVDVARAALMCLGVTNVPHVLTQIFCVHFFKQTCDLQGSYAWHTDCRDLCLIKRPGLPLSNKAALTSVEGLRSVVVQLSPTEQTAMCIWGCEPSVYEGRGAGKAFHGSAVHCGVPWDVIGHSGHQRPVWKVSMFWLPAAFDLVKEEW